MTAEPGTVLFTSAAEMPVRTTLTESRRSIRRRWFPIDRRIPWECVSEKKTQHARSEGCGEVRGNVAKLYRCPASFRSGFHTDEYGIMGERYVYSTDRSEKQWSQNDDDRRWKP
jgi:hypothetical protein